MTLTFDFSKAVNLSLAQIPLSSKSIIISPDNGYFAHAYSANTYSMGALISEFYDVSSLITLSLLGFSYFVGGKMIVVEMAIVLQVAYLSTITAPQLNPFTVALTHLRALFSPIDSLVLFGKRPFDDVMTTQKIKGAQLFSQFIFNFNIAAAYIVIPIIIGLIIFLISRCFLSNP
jgi:hypothetical protein